MVKDVKIYFIGLKKKTCLGVLNRGERGDDNGTSLKEGGGVEMSTTVLSINAMLLRLKILTRYIFRVRKRTKDTNE